MKEVSRPYPIHMMDVTPMEKCLSLNHSDPHATITAWKNKFSRIFTSKQIDWYSLEAQCTRMKAIADLMTLRLLVNMKMQETQKNQ